MGLLDGLLGQVLSGALQPGRDDGRDMPDLRDLGGAQGGQGMGGLESILGGLAGAMGGPGAGAGPSTGSQGGGALVAILLQMLQHHGGLGGLLSQLQQAGYGKQADSWVSTGGNEPISGDILSKILGREELDGFAQQLGTSRGQAADELASALPEVVDRMTPKGSVPGDSDDIVNRALEILQRGGR